MTEWHHLFGLALKDFFTDSAYQVELEKDLSLKQQFLDVVIIEQEAQSPIPQLPDGLENLSRHNLVTFKSIRQPLDGWSLDELVGHYVNYRKQESPSVKRLLPAEDFRLYAVTTRKPQKLATAIALKKLKRGIYQLQWGSHQIRVVVLNEVRKVKRNAIWQLFSGVGEKVQFGASHYQWRRTDTSTVIYDLYQHYKVEGIVMPYTLEDYYKDFTRRHLDWLTKEELLERLSIEDRLKGLPAKDRLKGLPAESFLKSLPSKEIEAYVKKLRRRPQKRK